MNPHDLAVEVATRVHDAVAPHLGTFEARVKVGDAPGGDATLAIDEVAETVVRECLASEGDIAFYSEDQGLVRFGTPRAILVIDPVDGTRPSGENVLESCCVSIAVVPADEQATLGEVSFGIIHELKTGQRFVAERGAGARAEEVDGGAIPVSLSTNTDLDALFWTAGLRGRPSLPTTVVLEELVDRSGMRGGYFDLGSATFNITRIVTGRLDAYIDVGRRILDEFPETEAAFLAVGDGNVCTNFPYDVAAAALILEEAGGVITHADGRSLAGHPAVGSSRAEGLAVIAAASPALHAALIQAIDRGMTHLGSWFDAARGH